MDLPAPVLNLLATPAVPDLGPGPRAGVLPLAKLGPQVNQVLAALALSPEQQEVVRSVIYLWHDHAEAAHDICQHIDTPEGSWIHGVLHRREPDFGNARYWFRRVGRPAGFTRLAQSSSALLATQAFPALAKELLPDGRWDALAFIDACENAAHRRAETAEHNTLRQIQGLEFQALLGHLGPG